MVHNKQDLIEPIGISLVKISWDDYGHITEVNQVTKADITALGIPAQDTTYSAAGTSLGLVKSGGNVTISDGIITVNDDSHNHTIDNIDGLQASLNGKITATDYYCTLSAANWSATFPYTQTVTVTGVLESDQRPIVDIDLSDESLDAVAVITAWCTIGRVKTVDNAIIAYCYSNIPEVDIPISIKVFR